MSIEHPDSMKFPPDEAAAFGLSEDGPQRPDAADDLLGEVVSAFTPLIQRTADQAGILALDAALRMADDLRDNFPGVPGNYAEGAFHGVDSLAYMAGWDEALMALVARLRAARSRIQQYDASKA